MSKKQNHPNLIISENAQYNDSAFGKTLNVDELFAGANAIAALPEVESVELTKFSDIIISLKNEPGKIQVINYNGNIVYRNGCKPKHVAFVATNFPKIKSFAKLNIF